MISLATLAMAGCLAVGGPADRILARDFAAAIPGFGAPVPEAVVALAPAPGVKRIFHPPELRRLALRLHWDGEFLFDICVERRVVKPDPAQFLAAMQRTLPDADIRVMEYSRQAIPEGELEFPVAGLRPSGEGALWAGYVRYAGGRRFTIWARARVSMQVTRVIAAVDLKAGQRLTAEQLRVETLSAFPRQEGFLQSIETAMGLSPRLPVLAGAALRAGMFEKLLDVMRGDTVTVDVYNGAAHLELEAKAESSGSAGQTISVQNFESHKRFVARVEGKGRVSVGVSVGTSAIKVNP